ncbi:MAG: sodium:solute symporter [Rikenellaceae bacterium]
MTPPIVALTLLLYILVLLFAAFYSSRKAKNSDYFVAGRSLQWHIAAMAMVAAAMSGVTFVSVPGAVGADSFSYMQMTLGFTAGQLVIAFVLIPIFYKLRITSLYEYLDMRFGSVSHRTGAWFFFLAKVTLAALRLYVMITVLQLLLFDHYNIPLGVNVAVCVGIVWLATRRGGVKSLVWTDTIKTLCLVGSLVLSIIFIMQALGWSASELISKIDASPHSQVLFLDDPASPKYFWKMFFAGLFSVVAMTGLDQDMMQCNLSCVDYRHAQKNIVVTAICQIIIIALFLILGAMLYEYAAFAGLELPAKSDQLYSLVAVEGGLPIIVGILFILGLTASSFASSASALTALTTSCTIDLLRGAKNRSEQQLTRVRHWVHFAIALTIAALILIVGTVSDQSVINVVFKFVGYVYGPILGMFAFGILTKWRVDDRWVGVVAIASLIISIVGEWMLREYCGYIIGFELLIYNAAITFGGFAALHKKD